MSTRPATNREYYDTYVRPFLSNLGIGDVLLGPIDGFVDASDQVGDALGAQFEALLPPAPGQTGDAAPSPLALEPITPSDAMREVAEAVRDAETKLNEANLAIANASAEVTMLVNIGGVAGANAKVNVTIAPTLQNIED